MPHRTELSILAVPLVFALMFPPSPAPLARPGAAQGAGGPEQRATPEAVLAEMGWLAGTWSGDMWGGRFEAHYSTPEGGRILSHSRLFVEGAERYYEFEVFEPGAELVRLTPYPRGKAADGFTLSEHDPVARKAVFENPEKDYPTRIVYQRVADDELVITLSDPHGGSEKTEVFDLRR